MHIFILFLIFAAIAYYEIPGLLRKKQWPELITSSVLLATGFILSFLQVIGVKVPNPNKGIEYLIKLLTS
ncbi:hypothetical protein [Desulfitobacterium metallireducens]|uniref:Uncharacterized protein n=1 Tax=Desulfitobacterium metallireducens DSM 15288 TaxID=871968 RepID=W0E4Y7_9FIRM|nr:hypothetical protein [Desulfitobacterium metallireducens]AHF05812.1 hypothetical protein DESME_00920 [Desulfitobacterium metallireducens DSM 15288]